KFFSFKTFFIIFTGAFILSVGFRAEAEVDKDSIFIQARTPLSELDLILYDIENQWRHAIAGSLNPSTDYPKLEHIFNNNPYFADKVKSIIRTEIDIRLKYENNRIDSTCYIGLEILNMTEQERKKLAHDILEVLHNIIGFHYGVTVFKEESLTLLDKKHILLRLKCPILKNSEGEIVILKPPVKNLRTYPNETAWYIDGLFIYSVPYYLKLKIIDEYLTAVAGDPNNFVIESE
ncbi:MAG: hypothetical protein ACTSQG_09495, partial [Promethearchaeota archaeon]